MLDNEDHQLLIEWLSSNREYLNDEQYHTLLSIVGLRVLPECIGLPECNGHLAHSEYDLCPRCDR